MSRKGRNPKPSPPAPSAKRRSGPLSQPKSFGGYRVQETGEFSNHAQEVRDLQGGQDFVENRNPPREQRPAPFDRKELQVVRSWVKRRPLEPHNPAAAMVPYPRQWNSKRGRYARFKMPGAAAYGLLRARPTF